MKPSGKTVFAIIAEALLHTFFDIRIVAYLDLQNLLSPWLYSSIYDENVSI
jgi:hypothetical protein